jgi:NitT/TauT family transport system substrate-binding protein
MTGVRIVSNANNSRTASVGRPLRWIVVLLACLGLALFAAACGGDDDSGDSGSGAASTSGSSGAATTEEPRELTKVTLRTDWLANGSHAGFYWAKAKGYYEEAGLDVEILEGQGSTQTVQLVGTGKEDFGFVASVALVPAVAEGAPVKTVATIVQANPAGILVRGDAGIEDPRDLEGMTCAISPYGYIHRMLPAFYERVGLPPRAMREVSVDSEAVLPSIRRGGRIQALCDMLYEDVDLEVMGVPAKVFRFSEYDLNVLAHGIVTNEKMLEEQPEVVQAFVTASLRGFEEAFAARDEAIDIIVEAEPATNREHQRKVIDVVAEGVHTPASEGRPLGWMAPEDWEATVALMEEYLGLDTSKLPEGVEGLYTNEFVEQGQ